MMCPPESAHAAKRTVIMSLVLPRHAAVVTTGSDLVYQCVQGALFALLRPESVFGLPVFIRKLSSTWTELQKQGWKQITITGPAHVVNIVASFIAHVDPGQRFMQCSMYGTELYYHPNSTDFEPIHSNGKYGELMARVVDWGRDVESRKITLCAPSREAIERFVADAMAHQSERMKSLSSAAAATGPPDVFEVLASREVRSLSGVRLAQTFDNLLTPAARHLRGIVETFATSKDEYRRLGVSYKIGLLLHGPPGGGKSALIAAIANATRRSPVFVRMRDVSTITDVMDMMMSAINEMSACGIVIVLEEIDFFEPMCRRRALDDVVDVASSCSSDDLANNRIAAMPSNEHQVEYLRERKEEARKNNLGQLLAFLDSGITPDELFVVATTNRNPEDFDPALTRNGRLTPVHVGAVDRECVQQYGRLYLSDASFVLPDDVVLPAGLMLSDLSARVLQPMLSHRSSAQRFLDLLRSLSDF